MRDLTDDFSLAASYGPVVSDRDGPADDGGSADEGLISRFWKSPPPSPAVAEPVGPDEPEADPD